MKIKLLRDGARTPTRATDGDAGLDLYACIDGPVRIAPGGNAIVPAGVAMAVPYGFVGMVCPRSGLAAKNQVTVGNAPGIVDAGYRGEVMVILQNNGDDPYTVRHGDRIAQLVIVPFVAPELEIADDLADTDRGAGGFGHSGV